MSMTWTNVALPRHQPVLVVDRRDHVDVGLVDGGEVGVVQQEDVARVDAAVPLEAFDDPLDREARAGGVPDHGLPYRQHVAVGHVERRHVVRGAGWC